MKSKCTPIVGLLIMLFMISGTAQNNKVLIIGIDGTRPDALLNANTPNIDDLWQHGAYSFKAKTDEISSSGICWTGMMTGVWHDKHNVTTNAYKNPNVTEYPHFFRRYKQFDAASKRYSIVHWAPLHKILQEGDATDALNVKSDAAVSEKAVNRLQEEDVDVLFVHLDDVDHAGHSKGFGAKKPSYLTAIEQADIHVGEIIAGLKSRPNYKDENWLVLVSTDHGGSDFGHGKDIPEHTTIFYIASGKDAVKGEIKEQVNVIDIAVTALHHLGVERKDEWNLDGVVRGISE